MLPKLRVKERPCQSPQWWYGSSSSSDSPSPPTTLEEDVSSADQSSCDSNFKLCGSCQSCKQKQLIAKKAVEKQQNKQNRSLLVTKESKLFGMPFPKVAEPSRANFKGKILGYDKQGYIYIRNLTNEEQTEVEHKKLISEIRDYYNKPGNENLRCSLYRDISKFVIGELCISEMIPKKFQRVQVIRLHKDEKMLTVVDVDTGDFHDVDVFQLYKANESFFRFPFRVIRCILHGTEPFIGTRVLETLEEQVGTRIKEMKNILMSFVKLDDIPTVFCCSEEKKLSLGMVVRKAIERFNPLKNLQEEELIRGGVITNVASNRLCYRMRSAISDFLTNLQPTRELPKDPTGETVDLFLKGQKYFVAFDDKKKTYQRVSIMSESQPNRFIAIFFDIGYLGHVDIRDVFSMDYFDSIICRIPFQSYMFSFNDIFLDDLRETLKLQQSQCTEINNIAGTLQHELVVVNPSFDTADQFPQVLPKITVGRTFEPADSEDPEPVFLYIRY